MPDALRVPAHWICQVQGNTRIITLPSFFLANTITTIHLSHHPVHLGIIPDMISFEGGEDKRFTGVRTRDLGMMTR